MGKITGFLEFQRLEEAAEAPRARTKHWREFIVHLTDDAAGVQAARCMDCGIPFCNQGCPVNNIIPDFNDLVYRQDWKTALDVLHSTNNFPEFTGRVCPAPCEAACTLNIHDAPVGIKSIEHKIIDKGWEEGWVVPQPPDVRTGKKVAIVGSGAAGLAAAQQLARVGHDVTVFEKNDRIGGLLRYGIPDFKMEKSHIDRRARADAAEGVTFRTGVLVGELGGAPITNWASETVEPKQLLADFDAVILAGGAEQPRDLPVPGRAIERCALCDGLFAAQNKRRRWRQGDGPNCRDRQARDRDRWWRYRLGLRRHQQSPRRKERDAVGAAAAAAGQREQAFNVALLADQVADFELSRRGRAARLGDCDQGVQGQCRRERDRTGRCPSAVAGRHRQRTVQDG